MIHHVIRLDLILFVIEHFASYMTTVQFTVENYYLDIIRFYLFLFISSHAEYHICWKNRFDAVLRSLFTILIVARSVLMVRLEPQVNLSSYPYSRQLESITGYCNFVFVFVSFGKSDSSIVWHGLIWLFGCPSCIVQWTWMFGWYNEHHRFNFTRLGFNLHRTEKDWDVTWRSTIRF